jgi:hypothetical protein
VSYLIKVLVIGGGERRFPSLVEREQLALPAKERFEVIHLHRSPSSPGADCG